MGLPAEQGTVSELAPHRPGIISFGKHYRTGAACIRRLGLIYRFAQHPLLVPFNSFSAQQVE